jgi:predicted nucleotidyltransferase
MSNKFGLYPQTYELLIHSFKKFTEVEQVMVFGSRAMGNYKQGSDLDLALFGSNIDLNLITQISALLNEELPIPYHIDVVHFETIELPALKDHIVEQGKILYKRSS